MVILYIPVLLTFQIEVNHLICLFKAMFRHIYNYCFCYFEMKGVSYPFKNIKVFISIFIFYQQLKLFLLQDLIQEHVPEPMPTSVFHLS